MSLKILGRSSDFVCLRTINAHTSLYSYIKVFLLTVPRRYFFCGSFLLVILHVGVLCCCVSSCSLVVTWWERADPLAVVFVVFCHFPKCVLVHIRIKGEVGAVKLV